MNTVIGKAQANPTKAFFVRMLTRDISLDDCILDLVDNSLDGAWRISAAEPSVVAKDEALAAFKIDLRIDGDRFSVTDNCGGITFDQAADYAFTFGRQDTVTDDDAYSVGVYGIGMKRAVFKLGNHINIRSSVASDKPDDETRAFRVPIVVTEWLERPGVDDWDFDIEADEPLLEPGVSVEVGSLSEDASRRFSDPTYANHIVAVLARDYLLPLRRGLVITVNGRRVAPIDLPFREGGDFSPARRYYDDGVVRVEIFSGMLQPPPDDSGTDDSDRSVDRSGWYVFCNARCVVGPDTTALTGWGVPPVPRWHPQYRGFVGLVMFSSREAIALPMTTTKRNVDVSSDVYIRAVNEMADPARSWTNYTNERKQNVERAKDIEAATARVDMAVVPLRERVAYPRLRAVPREPIANVNYSVLRRRLRALAGALGDDTLSYRDVGIQSFEWAYERLVDTGDES